MEIVTSGTGAGSGALDLPFQRRNVEEWSRMDRVTGILEHARVETDHWAANTSHSSHKYGKVVDSRARNLADGSVQQRQRKQLEVFQAQVPGGSLQVIRTQSVTTSTTHNDFENLQLALNPLDLSSQKTKASVGRSGSIGGRRPPSRPRSLVGKAENSIFEEDKDDVDLRLSEVARICQQVHEKAKKELVSPSFHQNEDNKSDSSSNDEIRRIAAGKVREYERLPPHKTCDLKPTVQEKSEKISNGCFHVNISRKKSCSTEDLQENDDETDDEVWKRTSKVRRSLQIPASKNTNFDVIPSGNVRKLRKELEEGKHLHATRDISAIDTPDTAMNEGVSFKSRESEGHPKETRISAIGSSSNKRHSFVTVESLKEVRGRLRRLNSSPVSTENSVNEAKIEDVDDGIATEEFTNRPSKMRPYVYGADTVASQKFLALGTGSLESRISSRATNAGSTRSEEWYNRRKSYGFEPVHQEVNGDSLEKTNGESSTDSGICRSSETFGSSSWSRLLHKDNKLSDAHLNTSHTIHIKNLSTSGTKKSAKLRGTVVTLGSSSESSPQPEESKPHEENCHLIVNDFALSKKSGLPSEPTTITIPILPESESKTFHAAPKSLAERRELLLRHSLWMNNAEVKRHSIAVDESKYVRGEVQQHSNNNNNETRRHSYFDNNNGSQYHHSLPGIVNFKNDDLQEKLDQTVTTPGASYSTVALGESEENGGKRHKRVEFCKTEVHFAAEPGRFNIVETDEKPPPTNMFRRRRKTNPTPQVQTGLPEIRFGDSIYEKKLLSSTETSVHQIEINLNSPKLCTLEVKESENVLPVTREVFQDDADREDIVSTQANATIFASSANKDKSESEVINETDMQSFLLKDQSAIKPRSILKNNRKLRQFHLGELDHADAEDSESKWGVRLKPVENTNSSPTMWRSSVALQSSSNVSSEDKSFSSETELQKLLRSLRPATERTDQHKTVPGVEVKVVTGGTAWSVANRVKQAEDQKYVENKGYSTRVNFGAGETKVVTKEQQLRQETKHVSSPMYQKNDNLKPIWLRREERKQLVFTDDTANAEPNIKTTATAKLDNYGNSGRLQAVETLVSTRSGHPKITSISLHYEGDSSSKHEPTNGFADKQLHSEEPKSPSLYEKRTYENVKPKFSSETKVNEEACIPLSSYRKMKPLEQSYSLEKSECEESCTTVHRPQITTGNVPYQHKVAVNSNTYTKSNNKRLSLQNHTVPSSEVSSEQSTRKSRLDYKEERKSERSNTAAEKNIHNKASVSSKNRHVSLERLLKENSLEEQTTRSYNLQGKEKTVYSRRERSVSPSKRSSPRTSTASENKSASSTEMPIYQNLEIFSKRGVQRSDTESTIIEELTRAADEILQAVNGFTDEDSYKASTSDNDDEGRYIKGRKISSANLGTISEMPLQSSRRTVKKENSTTKVQQVTTKRQVRQTSSTSSIESLTKRLQEPSKKKGANGLGNRTSNRTARLLQRASSRELLLHASSSEDVASGAESRKPRLTRRSKTSANKNDVSTATKTLKKSSSTQQKESIEKTHGMRRKEVTDVNKPKERLPGSTNKHSPSAWKNSSTVTATTSRISNIKDEDRHRRDTSKLTSKTRSPRHKAEGTSRAPRTESREKSSEHHRIRNGGHSLSSACVVTKKKPNLVASHKEGDIQAVSKKMSH